MSIARHRELVVVSTIRAHPMHGYALVEVLEAGLGRALGLKAPAIYAILKRLDGRGWIAGEAERDGKHPERLVYRITPAGEAALPELVEACSSGDASPLTPLPAILAHMDVLAAPARRRVLERLLEARREDLSDLAPFAEHPGLTGVAFDLMRRHLQADFDVLEALLSEDHADGSGAPGST